MADPTLELLKELTEVNGIPGYEAQVRAVVRKHLEPLGKLSQDKIGSVICKAEGSAEAPVVMLAGHMDEIGFMIKQLRNGTRTASSLKPKCKWKPSWPG